jgi:hypothetical protein
MRLPLPHSAAAAVLLSCLVAGCGLTPSRKVSYETEEFDSTTTHTRSYAATEAQTCEAARRALLSQGYLIITGNQELVTGRKSFQPETEVHVEVEFRVVCARQGNAKSRSTIAFASALQDRYGVKKVNNSASVGVGAIGSLSLPFSSSDDAMVKVASETLTDDRFYDRFFALMERYLPESIEELPAPAPAEARPATPSQAPADVPSQAVPPSPTRG